MCTSVADKNKEGITPKYEREGNYDWGQDFFLELKQ